MHHYFYRPYLDARSENLFRKRLDVKTLNLTQKQKLAKIAELSILKEGIMYKIGQDNKMCRCLTTSKAKIVLKELHGVARK
jgi:hypothetical protein